MLPRRQRQCAARPDAGEEFHRSQGISSGVRVEVDAHRIIVRSFHMWTPPERLVTDMPTGREDDMGRWRFGGGPTVGDYKAKPRGLGISAET